MRKVLFIVGLSIFITGVFFAIRPNVLVYNITDIVTVDGQDGYLVYYSCNGTNEIAGPFMDLKEVEIYRDWLKLRTNYSELRYGVIPEIKPQEAVNDSTD